VLLTKLRRESVSIVQLEVRGIDFFWFGPGCLHGPILPFELIVLISMGN
jgi:hypothetical protein